MATEKLRGPVEELHGAVEKDGSVHRRKKFRDSNGNIIGEGKKEVYDIANPRDFKTNPPMGNELAHHNRWREACLRATQILQSAQPNGLTEQQRFHKELNHIPDYYSLEEAQALYAEYNTRFLAQLPNRRGTKPDSQAPVDKETGRPKRYVQIAAFIRAILYFNLKQAASNN